MSVLRVSKKTSLVIIIAICVAALLLLEMDRVSDFFSEFFVLPFGRSYNPINSAVYAILLFVGIFILSRVLPRMGVQVDGKFIASILPFVLLGSCLRVFQDAGIVDSVLLVSPLIYLVIFLYTFACLLLSLGLNRKIGISYYRPLFFFGVVPAVYFLVQLILRIVNLESLVLSFSLATASCAIAFLAFYGIHRIVKFEKFALDAAVVFSQMVDVSATYVGVTFYGYGEQHFLVRLVTEVFGSAVVFFVLDFIGVVLILLVLERILRKEQALMGLFRLTLIVLGIAPALRDILRVALLA